MLLRKTSCARPEHHTQSTITMPPPATKRRKLSPSDEEVDGASLLSSGDEPVAEADEAHHGNDHVDESSHIESDEDSGDNEDEVGGDGDSKLVRRDMPSSHGEQGTTSPKAKPKPKRPTEVRRNEASIGAAPFTGEVYKSNLFKLQVDDLLKQVRPKYQQKDKSIEQALRTLKGIIEAIPSRPPAPVCVLTIVSVELGKLMRTGCRGRSLFAEARTYYCSFSESASPKRCKLQIAICETGTY